MKIKIPSLNPFNYCSDTFRPIIQMTNPEVFKPMVSSTQHKNGGLEFFFTTSFEQLLSHHTTIQDFMDSDESPFNNPEGSVERLKTIIALKMLLIDNGHCRL